MFTNEGLQHGEGSILLSYVQKYYVESVLPQKQMGL
jgi:hypothetical protein